MVLQWIDLTSFRDKAILITGGAGFIGSEAVSQLLHEGAKVTVFDNFSSGKRHYLPKQNKKLRIIKGDITNERAVIKATKDQEIVLHLAALPFIPDSFYYPVDFFKVNTVGSMHVFWSAAKSKTVETVINISTSEVYGSAQYTPMDENHPTSPYSTYAVSKLAADRAAFTLHKESGFPVVILRPFNTFGPRYTEPYIIPEIIGQILRGTKELNLGNVNSTRDFTFVSDTVRGILKAMQGKKAIGEIINIGSDNTYNVNNLVELLKGDVVHIPKRPGEPDCTWADISKARRLLGYEPKIHIKDGVSMFVERYREYYGV